MIHSVIDFIVLNRSREWQSLDPKTRQELGIVVKEDGEFWYWDDVFAARFIFGQNAVVAFQYSPFSFPGISCATSD